MRNFTQFLSCCLVLALLFSNCNKEKLKAPPVSYLKIDTALVAVSSASQGTTSNKITDIWVYVDQQFKGAYPLGNLIADAQRAAAPGIDFALMVHGGQEFEWGDVVCSGEEITTTPKCVSIDEKP